jgi:hypothetical protein
MIGSLKSEDELKNISADDHHTSIRSLAVLCSVLYKPLQIGRPCLEDGEPINHTECSVRSTWYLISNTSPLIYEVYNTEYSIRSTTEYIVLRTPYFV